MLPTLEFIAYICCNNCNCKLTTQNDPINIFKCAHTVSSNTASSQAVNE